MPPLSLLLLILLFSLLLPFPSTSSAVSHKHQPTWTSPADTLHKIYCYCRTERKTVPQTIFIDRTGIWYHYRYHSVAYNVTYVVDWRCDSGERHLASECQRTRFGALSGDYCTRIADGGVWDGEEFCFRPRGDWSDVVSLGTQKRKLFPRQVRTRKSHDSRVVKGVCAPVCRERFAYIGGMEMVGERNGKYLGSEVSELRFQPICKDEKCPPDMPKGVQY